MALLTRTAPLNLSQVISQYSRTVGVNATGTATNTTVTVPAGTTMIVIELWGGGGTGGTASATVGGGAGGSGAYSLAIFTSGFTAGSSTITYYAGAAGVKSNATPNWTATTITANPGNVGGTGASGGFGGLGGTATNGNWNVDGNPGGDNGGAPGGLPDIAVDGTTNYGITQGTADNAGTGGLGGNAPNGAGSAGTAGRVKILYFGTSTPNTLSTYTRYGNYVPNHGNNSTILVGPLSTSNRQKLTNYLDTGRNYYVSMTKGSKAVGLTTYHGFNNGPLGTGNNFGSLPTALIGKTFHSSAQATIVGLYSYSQTALGITTYYLYFYVSGSNTGDWWNLLKLGTAANAVGRWNAVNGAAGTFDGTNTYWYWLNITTDPYGLIAASGTVTVDITT